jgi:hypothetical protein
MQIAKTRRMNGVVREGQHSLANTHSVREKFERATRPRLAIRYGLTDRDKRARVDTFPSANISEVSVQNIQVRAYSSMGCDKEPSRPSLRCGGSRVAVSCRILSVR